MSTNAVDSTGITLADVELNWGPVFAADLAGKEDQKEGHEMTDFDKYEVHVLVPHDGNLSVCPLDQLMAVEDAQSLDDLLENTCIDSPNNHVDPDEVMTLIERVRKLNLTGDANAYWGIAK